MQCPHLKVDESSSFLTILYSPWRKEFDENELGGLDDSVKVGSSDIENVRVLSSKDTSNSNKE